MNENFQIGDIVKKVGMVRYADGERKKISKKTWIITDISSDGKLFYRDEQMQEAQLTCAEGIYLIKIGDTKNGVLPEYQAMFKTIKIMDGSTGEKYRCLKDVPEKNWQMGDVVEIHGKVSSETLEKGVLEKVPYATPHKHALVVVDPVKLQGVLNQTKTN